MSKKVEQQKFQRGLLGLVFGFSLLSFLVTCFCVTRVDPNAVHHVIRDPGGWRCVDEAGLRADAQVIANHCIDEGIIEKVKELKARKAPAK